MSNMPAAVSGRLNARREAGVRALAEVLVPNTPEAVELALKRAAAAVAVPGLPAEDGDRAARDAARDAAAEHLEFQLARNGARPRGLLRRGPACTETPRAVAADLAGRLGDEDAERLHRHLARCPSCTALRNRFARADDAFDAAFPDSPAAAAAGSAVDWLATPPSPENERSWLPDGEPVPARTAPAPVDAPPAAADGHADSFVPPGLQTPAPAAEPEPEPVSAAPAVPEDTAVAAAAATSTDWLLPGEPVAPTAPHADPEPGAPAPPEPAGADAWLVEGLEPVRVADARSDDEGAEAWVLDDEAPVAPLRPGAVAAPPAARPGVRVLRSRGAAVLPVVVVLVGAGTMVAIASNVGQSDDEDSPPAAVVPPGTGAAVADATTKKPAAKRRASAPARKHRVKHRKRRTAKRPRTGAVQVAAAPAVAVQRPVSQPVQQTPVQPVQQTPVRKPVSQPVQKPVSKPVQKPAAQTSAPAPTVTPGPSGSAPSGETGRTPVGP